MWAYNTFRNDDIICGLQRVTLTIPLASLSHKINFTLKVSPKKIRQEKIRMN